MTHIELALTSLTAICFVLFPLALLFLRRIAKELVTLNKSASEFSVSGVNVADSATQSSTTLSELSESMAEMKRDFEWLVSDRMIELAINMAGAGQSQDSIAKHTGISASELDAIQKIAKH